MRLPLRRVGSVATTALAVATTALAIPTAPLALPAPPARRGAVEW